MPSADPRIRTAVRRVLDALGVGVGWFGFVWMWLLVAREPWDWEGLVWLIAGSLVIAPLLTAAWVMHNRSIHRRKGERRAVAVADTNYRADWRGRTVHADWQRLVSSRIVTIDVEGDRKVYRDAAAQPGAQPRPDPARKAADTLT